MITEGIENTAQEDFLPEHDYDIGQDCLFDRPVSSDELIRFVKERCSKKVSSKFYNHSTLYSHNNPATEGFTIIQ